MERLITSNVRTIDERQSGQSVDLILGGESGNANDLQLLRHQATATGNGELGARAYGLKDTNLVTRNLTNIDLDVQATGIDGPDWAWGMHNVQFDGESSRQSIDVNIDVLGKTYSTADPTVQRFSWWRTWSNDPVFGLSASSLDLSNTADSVYIRTGAEAGNWSNQAIAYGISGGHNALPRVDLAAQGAKSSLTTLRPSLNTGGGADQVQIIVDAANTGSDYSNTTSQMATTGRQRAVAIYRTYVDLAAGNDNITLKSTTTLNGTGSSGAQSSFWDPFTGRFTTTLPSGSANPVQQAELPGAHAIRTENAFFEGVALPKADPLAAGAVDLYEAGLNLGTGNDKLAFYNGWTADIWLGEGDDDVTLSAGKELFIHGGKGLDTVRFQSNSAVRSAFSDFRETTYQGIDDNWHVFLTDEGNVYLNSEVENAFINGQQVKLEAAISNTLPSSEPLPVGKPVLPTANPTLNPWPNIDTSKSWDDLINFVRGIIINQIVKELTGKFLEGDRTASVGEKMIGTKEDDYQAGFKGADQLIGDAGDDELRAGNGQDLIDGGEGADDMYGGRGRNTFESSIDGDVDTLYITTGQESSLSDIIEGLDATDEIKLQTTSPLEAADVSVVKSTTGLEGYLDGNLEFIYKGNNLTDTQLQNMISVESI